MRPFLKWAGGKYRIVDRLKKVLPKGQRLVEPFVGSGALFLNVDYPAYLLADVNKDLINLFQTVKEQGEDFIDYAANYFTPENNDKEAYYKHREYFNQTTDINERSALFLYLNRHGFNGLCRYNSRGEFNVPFGRYKKPYFPYEELVHFHNRSQHATFICADFEKIMAPLLEGDVVYCDPPYVPLSSTANFTGYSAGKFNLDQQRRLARLAEHLATQGIPVVISNHDTNFTREEYKNATRLTGKGRLKVQRHISCNGSKRTKANELIAIFEGDT